MTDRYHKPYMKLVVDFTANYPALPSYLFLDKALGLGIKHLIQAMDEGKSTSEPWHEVNNRLIKLLPQTNGDEAKTHTRQIEDYIKTNIDELHGLKSEEKPLKKVDIKQNLDGLLARLGLEQNGGSGYGFRDN